MKVFIATASFGQYSAEPLQLLKARGVEAVSNATGRTLTPEELVEKARGAAGIIAGTERYTADVLAKLPDLKAISRCGAGTDNVDLPAAKARGVAVLSTPDGPTRAVAELTVAFMLGLLRQAPQSTARIRRGAWEKPMGFLVGELTFGLIGLGRIGKEVAALLRAWDARVVASDLQPDVAWAAAHRVTLMERLAVFREADVVSLHIPYDKSVHHLVDEAHIAAMKPGACLINASRGGLVDEAALHKALKDGRLAGAALDVFETEPYKGPLKDLENVILTPHVGSYARAGRMRMERDAAQNLLDALRKT